MTSSNYWQYPSHSLSHFQAYNTVQTLSTCTKKAFCKHYFALPSPPPTVKVGGSEKLHRPCWCTCPDVGKKIYVKWKINIDFHPSIIRFVPSCADGALIHSTEHSAATHNHTHGAEEGCNSGPGTVEQCKCNSHPTLMDQDDGRNRNVYVG